MFEGTYWNEGSFPMIVHHLDFSSFEPDFSGLVHQVCQVIKR